MGVRDAVDQSGYLTAMVVAFGLWAGVVAVRTLDTIEGAWLAGGDVAAGDYVGQTLASGVVGLVVLLAGIVMLFVMFGEVEEPDPAPSPWPPEEER